MGDRDRGADGAPKAGDTASAENLGMPDLAGETVESVLERLVSVATTNPVSERAWSGRRNHAHIALCQPRHRLFASELARVRRDGPCQRLHGGSRPSSGYRWPDLEDSVATRGVIGQALGLLMARHGCCGEAVFEMLRRASQVSNRKLHTVAAEMVAEHERGASA